MSSLIRYIRPIKLVICVVVPYIITFETKKEMALNLMKRNKKTIAVSLIRLLRVN